MGELIKQHLERMTELGQPIVATAALPAHLFTELGDLKLAVPRTRTFSELRGGAGLRTVPRIR